jgi:hypothetical protein
MPDELSNSTASGENAEANTVESVEAKEMADETHAECSDGVCAVSWKPFRAA